MDNTKISLPCGFSLDYDHLLRKSKKFECPFCKTHEITIEECLRLSRNRLVLTEKSFELKKKQYEECLKDFEEYKYDPKHFIDLSHDEFKNEIDLRREEIKVMLNKKIDDYYDDALKKVQMEKDLKLKEFNKRNDDLDSQKREIDSIKIDDNLDLNSKLDSFIKSKNKMDDFIEVVSSIKKDLNESKYGLTDSIEDTDIGKLFGELYLKEETSFKYNRDEIDELSRSEATIQLKINDFSKLKNQSNFYFYSKPCVVRNFKWSIKVKVNEEFFGQKALGFYLECNSVNNKGQFPIYASIDYSLSSELNPKLNLTKSLNYLFETNMGYGFTNFFNIQQILDSNSSFFRNMTDSIILRVAFKVELPEKEQKKDFDTRFN